jgi:hypothetical protein
MWVLCLRSERVNMRAPSFVRCVVLAALAFAAWPAVAHEATPVTHSFDAGTPQPGPRLQLAITDEATGRPMPARFSLEVDGQTFTPEWIDEHGIRFTSIHVTKRQRFTALYARGTGPVTVGLPAGARQVDVVVARGFEYLTGKTSVRVEGDRVSSAIAIRRWSDLAARGWIGVEEHLHYDRLDPAADALWLTMLAGDDLQSAHFMVAKGGMMPGAWATQFAYGTKGQAAGGGRLIVPGEEYRDAAQGHILLLGVNEVIEPISTGGMGTPSVAENFPPLHDVLVRAQALDGLTGVAHGGMLSRKPTALADAVLGAVDFWEISNGFNYSTESWYRLMNCGIFLAPGAGTDLPNQPFRDPWQPMLGSVRTYVQTGSRSDFASFKAAKRAGRAFITEGPLIELTVDGKGPGETVRLPASGGNVTVRATLRSPQPLQGFQLIRGGRPVDTEIRRARDGAIDAWTIEQRIEFKESGWLAAAGNGVRIAAQGFDARAHTSAVRVLVGERPIRSPEDLSHLREAITRLRDFYRAEGRYLTEADRAHMSDVFERALVRLGEQR